MQLSRHYVNLFVLLIMVPGSVIGQISIVRFNETLFFQYYVSAPFLSIAPDARSAGTGFSGVATSPDVNSQHWNAAKYAFIEHKSMASLNYAYVPMESTIIKGMNLGYLSGCFLLDERNALSGSFRYFSLGKLMDMNSGVMTGPYYQYEFAVDAGYSRRITDHFSGGIVVRFIHSDLVDGWNIDGSLKHPGHSVAGDLGLYYQNDFVTGENSNILAFGLNLSNVGTPISYFEEEHNEHESPIPTNIRIGGRITFNLNPQNAISFHADADKYLVPTYPEYRKDPVTDEFVLYGKELPESVLRGMIQSFYDAPGYVTGDGTRSVYLEELHEIRYTGGIEYLLRDQYAFRTGYYFEHFSKGDRRFLTLGFGARFQNYRTDLSYLIPNGWKDSPKFNTCRISVEVHF